MRVGVGYCDNPDTAAAGHAAASDALSNAGRGDPCDLVLLFATSSHDAFVLRDAVASVVGNARIVGGGAVGAISNDKFGYAGNQTIAACIWLDGSRCDILTETLGTDEQDAGRRLGRRLKESGTKPDSPVTLFYDAPDHTGGGFRMNMSTWLIEGVEQGLGYLPNLTGAGLMSDLSLPPSWQWTGNGTAQQQVMAMTFSDDIHADNVIMHGCRPATRYYTVTKADGQAILEINGQPALKFIDRLLESAVPPERYPFFLMFGVNRGSKWEEFDEKSYEKNYASRLCLAVDTEHDAIIMFEPDMVEGTEFQLMYRTLDPYYMKPRIEGLFQGLGDDREPVLALYIDCAGRAAGYGGIDIEDAVMVQNTVANRVPLLGIYTGVEIAPVNGRSRGLDWTGVFCLFSTPKTQKTPKTPKDRDAK